VNTNQVIMTKNGSLPSG